MCDLIALFVQNIEYHSGKMKKRKRRNRDCWMDFFARCRDFCDAEEGRVDSVHKP